MEPVAKKGAAPAAAADASNPAVEGGRYFLPFFNSN
jgi:hypothetical protein